jgi:mono/diheme cytochrome c family protein
VGFAAAASISLTTGHAAGAELQLRNDQDVERFFATVCGWCHEDGGRREARGPQLMGTNKSDEYLMNRIATGSPGKMPAFGAMLSVENIEAIIHYIRNLKPRGESG